jgi:transglutaminase-like putative cysteine protease
VSAPAGSGSAVKLLIRHRTRYRYSAPVKESFNELRLQPVSNEHQTCEDFQLCIEPQVAVRRYLDFYRNWVHHFDLAAPHTALVVESRTRVTTNRANWLDPDATPMPLTRLPELARMERCFDYLQSSDQIGSDPAVWRLAVDATAGQTDLWQAAQALNRFVHSHLTYTPRSTHATTHMRDALAARVGVCQDFAHVLIGMCRSLQIPALYVSGYLCTPGAQASHAWAEVFLPDIGWRSLDPTHARQPDERYVKIAVGRDYADVPPTRGHYKGVTQRTMDVDVSVEEILGEG